MQNFIEKIVKTLEANGFPEKKVSLPTEKMYEAADNRELSFNQVLEKMRAEFEIQSEVGTEKIVFFKEKAPAPGGLPQSPSNGEPAKEIHMIEARGHVRIFKGESRATSEHALYYKQEEKVILRGSPVAWQEGTKISGPKMTMYLRENRSVVEGGTRVVIEEKTEN